MEIDNQRNTNILIGATVGAVVLPATILILGLTPIGPVAGGIFAGFQAGGLVTAGGALATVQSIAMGGSVATAVGITATTTVTGAGIGAAISKALGVEPERQ